MKELMTRYDLTFFEIKSTIIKQILDLTRKVEYFLPKKLLFTEAKEEDLIDYVITLLVTR